MEKPAFNITKIVTLAKENLNLKSLAFLISIFALSSMLISYYSGAQRGELADPDCYMRLNRVLQLHDTGQWYDPVIHRSNAPYGETLHWTRPLDTLLYAGAFLATPFVAFKTALFNWGVIISPVLLVISTMIMFWTANQIFNEESSFFAVCLFLVQFGTLATYAAGRPDHHSLLATVFIIITGLSLRITIHTYNKSLCYLAGIAGALSIWIHVESLLIILALMITLGLLWIINDDESLLKNIHFSISLLIATGVALLLERPPGNILSIEFDRISFVHVCIVGLLTACWILLWILNTKSAWLRQRWSNRLSAVCIGGMLVAIAIALIFPRFFKGPYADVDPKVIAIWMRQVNETQSPLTLAFLVPLTQLFIYAGIATAFVIHSIIKRRHESNIGGWIFLIIVICLFLPGALIERRFLIYAQIATILPSAAFLGHAIKDNFNHNKPSSRIMFTLTIIIFLVGPTFLSILINKAVYPDKRDSANKNFSIIGMCDYLNVISSQNGETGTILAFIDYGPEILLRTGYSVVATPYHRNADGIVDSYEIMTADKDEISYSKIEKRNIRWILISNNRSEEIYYKKNESHTKLYVRLLNRQKVDWLREEKLPSSLSGSFLLYRVVK